MPKECEIRKSELETLAEGLATTFVNRRDIQARQTMDGGYICLRKPLQLRHLTAHLKGEITLGAYLLDEQSRAKYVAFDADTDEQMEGLAKMAVTLSGQGVPSYLEESRRGGHLWLFFSRPIPGRDARRFGHKLLERNHLEDLELFPKQDSARNGPGSLIRLPFGVHRKSGLRYGFRTPQGNPLAASLSEQMRILCAPETVPDGFLRTALAHEPVRREKPLFSPVQEPTAPSSASLAEPTLSEPTLSEPTLSGRIKDSATVFDFVSQYVELSPSGRGRCPFHDDQHASFAVNLEKNYWCCFAGCGGGSLIDFWMKYRDCDFSAAVRELASVLLTKR